MSRSQPFIPHFLGNGAEAAFSKMQFKVKKTALLEAERRNLCPVFWIELDT
jgi:hypothetical protein